MSESSHRQSRVFVVLIPTLFFLSGATSLAYQTIWFRHFSIIWGSSSQAMAAVVASFLVGLAAGAKLADRYSRQLSNSLAAYGYLELIVGVSALLAPWLIRWLADSSLAALARQLDYPVALFFTRSLLTYMVIGLPCMCMGGTLPLLVGFQTTHQDTIGRTTGWLYGVNTLGAAAGCYLTGFHLLPTFGSTLTNSIMGSSNLMVACAAIAATLPLGRDRSIDNPIEPAAVNETLVRVGRGRIACVLLTALLSGFAALTLEMVWARQLAVMLGGATYTFTATLCILLLGIGIGGLLYKSLENLASRSGSHVKLAVHTILWICTLTVLAQIAIPSLSQLTGALLTFRGSNLGNGAICSVMAAVLELAPAIGMGVLFPALARAARSSRTSVTGSVGSLYMWNTIGSALGAILTSSLLVPVMGTMGAVSTAVAAYLLAIVSLLVGAGYVNLLRLASTYALAVALLLMIALHADSPMASNLGMYLYGPRSDWRSNLHLVYFKEGSSCNVLVTESRDGSRALRVNGKVDAGTGADQPMQLGCAYFPRFLRPQASSVCVIGLGSGTTAGASLLFPDTKVCCFEIEPAVFEGCKHFARINHAPWESPRFQVVFDDARGAIQTSTDMYDLIISEPSNPWISGVSNLYTREFYAVARRRLRPNGMLAQWVQTYNFTRHEFGLIVRTMLEVFPHVGLIRISEGDLMLVTSDEPVVPDSIHIGLSQAMVDASAEIQRDLRQYWGTTDVRSLLLSHLILGQEGVEQLATSDGRTTINTDINMRLEFDAPRQLFRLDIPESDVVETLIRDAFSALWFERLVDQWKCTSDQTSVLAALLETTIINKDQADIERMIALCRRVDPQEPYFLIAELVFAKGHAVENVAESFGGRSMSEDMAIRAHSLGVRLWRARRYQEAAVIFDVLVGIFPESATSWMNLAVNYSAMGHTERASMAIERSLLIDPLNAFVRERSKTLRSEISKSAAASMSGN